MRSEWRLADAALNRAREAARVLEDLARFVLDSGDLSETFKGIRDDLRTIARSLDAGMMLAHRDTAADAGAGLSSKGELHRGSAADVAAAAEGRLGEALRSIEEVCKVLGRDAGPAKRLRYRAYDASAALRLALGTGSCPQWRLCVLITEAQCVHMAWEELAQRAVEGGADCLQLREKGLNDAALLARARRLVEIAHGAGAHAVINDRADIALLAGADGVHLGGEDLPVRAVRELVGFRLWVGASTRALHAARAAALAGADYIGVGAMFPTATRDAPVRGPGYLAEVLADPILSRRPSLAIGGITPANVGELVRVGCRGVAVCSCVCGAEDPAGVCRAIVSALGQGGGGV